MKFFSRCRILCGILTGLLVILGIVIAFRIPDIIDKYSGANPLINSLLVSLFWSLKTYQLHVSRCFCLAVLQQINQSVTLPCLHSLLSPPTTNPATSTTVSSYNFVPSSAGRTHPTTWWNVGVSLKDTNPFLCVLSGFITLIKEVNV